MFKKYTKQSKMEAQYLLLPMNDVKKVVCTEVHFM